MPKKDNTVVVSIVIAVLVITLLIIVGVTCKDHFQEWFGNSDTKQNLSNKDKFYQEMARDNKTSLEDKLFKRWYNILKSKNKNLTMEEAKKSWGGALKKYLEFMEKPQDKLTQEQKIVQTTLKNSPGFSFSKKIVENMRKNET